MPNDAMKLATHTLQVDDARVRVTEWRFAPGAHTGHHVHELDYVVVPLTAGRLRQILPDGGIRETDLAVGQSYARPKGVEHDVVNPNPHVFAFVEIELK